MDNFEKKGRKGPLIEIPAVVIIIGVLFFIFFFAAFYLFPDSVKTFSGKFKKDFKIDKIKIKLYTSKSCGEETSSGNCSLIKPYFCDGGFLVEKASVCGCSNLMIQDEDSCISKYQTEPKNITLKYVLRGKEGKIDYVVYKGMNDYVANLSTSIYYSNGKKPSRIDFKLKNIDEPNQREFILPLVMKIQDITNNKEDQLRIAVSLVQMIPFQESEKNITFFSKQLGYSRRPYEVLYEYEGVCGEKSELLALILREMGYGVAFFYNNLENHESLGVKCPIEYSWYNSSYCFVETTGPSIITDNNIEYVGGIKLKSRPEVMVVSEGNSLGNDLYEYKDARDWKELRVKINEKWGVGVLNYFKWRKLSKKYKLVDIYFP